MRMSVRGTEMVHCLWPAREQVRHRNVYRPLTLHCLAGRRLPSRLPWGWRSKRRFVPLLPIRQMVTNARQGRTPEGGRERSPAFAHARAEESALLHLHMPGRKRALSCICTCQGGRERSPAFAHARVEESALLHLHMLGRALAELMC
jgi:hypothetical protein